MGKFAQKISKAPSGPARKMVRLPMCQFIETLLNLTLSYFYMLEGERLILPRRCGPVVRTSIFIAMLLFMMGVKAVNTLGCHHCTRD
ncbi:hypothetical protein V8D89_003428 [Ganoderma adspersum]